MSFRSVVLAVMTVACSSQKLSGFLFKSSQGYGISVGAWQQHFPCVAWVVSTSGVTKEFTTAYTSWQGSSSTATATLTTDGGSQLFFHDVFTTDPNGFKLSRTVSVQTKGKGDHAFSTLFSMQVTRPSSIHDREFFMPGVWYRNSDNVPSPWFGTDESVQYVLVREDRTAYPLIMTRNPSTSYWSSLIHLSPDGSTVQNDNSICSRIVNPHLQYGSIGVVNTDNIQLAFLFPGSEGETTRCGGSTKADRWQNRSHPLTKGFSHSYQLAFIQNNRNSFAEAVQTSWRYAYASANPKPPTADREAVFRQSVGLLGKYIQKYSGTPSVPFTVDLTSGEVKDTSSQFGFTGKASLAAAIMIAANMGKTTVKLITTDSTWLNNAVDIIDTWVDNSMTPSGVPKTWYDVKSGSIRWRPASKYQGHIRTISDGVNGVITAWKFIQKPSWLKYCKQVGNFFVQNQAVDGSFAGAWSYSDGSALANYQNTTHSIIPFLLDLYKATGIISYKTCAVKAGLFSFQNVHKQYMYAGGAADNPNVRDKESGVLALSAFLALYEETKDSKWLTAAVQAGTYCETFVYIWSVPQFTGEGYLPLPSPRTMIGSSLVATGRSAADNYMAVGVHLFKRLYDYTCDKHFLEFSTFLASATPQLMNWDGKLGYAHPGLLPEAISIVDRGNVHKAGGDRKSVV